MKMKTLWINQHVKVLYWVSLIKNVRGSQVKMKIQINLHKERISQKQTDEHLKSIILQKVKIAYYLNH